MPVSAARPNSLADSSGSGGPSRSGKYSENYALPISNKEFFSADEGSYFVAITPTAGTGIVGHAASTTFDEAKALVTLFNGGTLNIYPQFLQLHVTVVGTGEVRVQFTQTLDYGNRRSSAGTALVANNVNGNASQSTGLTGFIGAVVTTAATANRRLLGHFNVRGSIDVIEDVYELVWGGLGGGTSVGSRAATVSDASRTLPPVVIGPGQTLCLHQWSASQSVGLTVEAVLGYIER